MNDENAPAKSRKDGKRILICFLAFFGLICVIDGIFVYTAITTQTGVVTEQPYEKGLAFNKQLDEARAQPSMRENITFADNVLRWTLQDENGVPVRGAQVHGEIVRPVQEGYDFAITLTEAGGGIYETTLDLPLKGLWVAKLNGQWNSTTYKTSHEFMNR
jgi:nitrogen fixation protein FixH